MVHAIMRLPLIKWFGKNRFYKKGYLDQLGYTKPQPMCAMYVSS
jgi:hypothetical protein